MANQIQTMGFSSLTVGLHCDYHYQALGLMEAAGAEALHIEALLAAYSELVESEMSIVRRQTAYVSTAQLNEADRERDNALGVVLNIITAHLTNTIEAKRTAAQVLDALVAPYRKIRYHEKRTETREIAGMLDVLTTDEAAAHLATLSLVDELAALSSLNAAFETASGGKLQEEVARTPQTDIETEELRKQVDAKYAEIVQTVNAYAIVQPTEAIDGFITQMNALITLTKRTAASMGGEEKENVDVDVDDNGTAL